jgi:outer membrane immunogenic protein
MNIGKVLYATAFVSSMVGTSISANAADLPQSVPYLKAPIAYAPAPFSWTGFYVGGNLGAGWSQGNITDSFFGLNYSNPSNNAAFLGGGQVGANYQMGIFVAGVEGDFDWLANNQNSGPGTAVAGTTLQASSNDRWVTTLAARFGVAVDRVLFYAKGGGGWVGNGNFTITNVPTGASASYSNGNTNSGWLAGGGVEWAFARNWSVRLEYDYLGLNNQSFVIPATFPVAALAGDTFSTRNRDIQMATVGLNYHFNWGGY